MNKLVLIFGFALAATGGIAQAGTHDHFASQHQAASQANQSVHAGTGVLKAVNAKDGKVQIAHQSIDSLGWPAMTMWFVLRGPLPQDIKAGDGVRFELAQENGKQWVIVAIKRK